MEGKVGFIPENTDALHYKVFTVKRDGVNRDPNMPSVQENLKWAVNTATLIYGEKDAVLIDTFMTDEQSKSLIESIAATGKKLRHIYFTHSNGDYCFGLHWLLDRFPKAKAITTAAIVKDMSATLSPEISVNDWETIFTGETPERTSLPNPMEDNAFHLEGYTIQIIDTGFTDGHHSASIYVPCIGLLVAGDVVYNGVHPYLAETTQQTRKEWMAALDELESLHPKAVVAGQKNPGLPDSPDNIVATKKYLEDFDRLNNETSSAKELFDKMLGLYPQLANPDFLWGAAVTAKQ